MKKILSAFLILAIILVSLQINSFAKSYDSKSLSNDTGVEANTTISNNITFSDKKITKETFTNKALNLSKYTIEDLLHMSSEEFMKLVENFEKVYDPFDTYKNRTTFDNDSGVTPDSIIESINRLNVNFEGQIDDSYLNQSDVDTGNTNNIETGWTSGAIKKGKWVEKGVHEYVTISSCIMMAKDKGFYCNDTRAVAITLIISLASLLPDDEERGIIPFAGHFINPETGKNFAGQKSNTVVTNAQKHYNIAINEAEKGNMLNAYYHLGFCLHYVQDANNPHHASNLTILHKYGDSHSPFESYTQEHFDKYLEGYDSMSDVYYKSALTTSVSDITFSSAMDAHSYIDDVKYIKDKSKWDDVSNIVIKHSARDTTMILYKFAKESGVTFYEKQSPHNSTN